MSKINTFLLENGLSIASNPCISQDFCLNWTRLRARLERSEALTHHPLSAVETAVGTFSLLEDSDGDHAWLLRSDSVAGESALSEGHPLSNGEHAFPATWHNLLSLKHLIQEYVAVHR